VVVSVSARSSVRTRVKVRLLTRSELASCCEVTPTAIEGWIRRGCPIARRSQGPGRGRGTLFRLPDVVRWRERRRAGKASSGSSESTAIRERLKEIRLAHAEIDIAFKRGELKTVAEFTEAIGAIYGRVSARLKSLPPALAAAAVEVGMQSDAVRLARFEEIVLDLLRSCSGEQDESDDVDETPHLALATIDE
jgi:phage terminase Nu1 subunit (DNA packaging protein)